MREAHDALSSEQAALRRVATLVAKESPPADVLAQVAEEVASLLGDVDCSLFKDEGDGTATLVALASGNEVGRARLGARFRSRATA